MFDTQSTDEEWSREAALLHEIDWEIFQHIAALRDLAKTHHAKDKIEISLRVLEELFG